MFKQFWLRCYTTAFMRSIQIICVWRLSSVLQSSNSSEYTCHSIPEITKPMKGISMVCIWNSVCKWAFHLCVCVWKWEKGEKTGMHQRKTAKQISGGRPPCFHQRGAVTATTPHKYLTVIFKLQNTETPASDKNTYSWNYQRNAKSWPSAPPSLLSL